MKNKYRKGWHGNSHGHSLAARGISMYAKKKTDPLFFAMQREKEVPFTQIMSSIRNRNNFQELQEKFPRANVEDLRKRAIRATEIQMADDTITQLDEQGVDRIVEKANASAKFKETAQKILDDPEKRSFLKGPKASVLRERLK